MEHLARNAALILIDLQQAIDDPSWGVRNNACAEGNVAKLLVCWRSSGRPVIHVRYVSREPQSTYRAGQPGVEFKTVALPEPSELVLTKPAASAFIGTSLEAWLRERVIDMIVLVGVITNNSVEATARNAGDLGFRCCVVCDATFTFGKRDFYGVERTADEVHAMSLANIADQYAEVLTTDSVLSAANAS